jgi:hypothetical protein
MCQVFILDHGIDFRGERVKGAFEGSGDGAECRQCSRDSGA